MRTLEQFLSALEREASIDADERARYAALWPEAAEVADQYEHELSSVPRFSPRGRRQAFFHLCERIDVLQSDEALSDEQAQLVLTLLRSRHAGYRRAETSFVAWAHSVSGDVLAGAPLTARQFLMGLQHQRQSH